ncbi:hypothetical protein BMR1_02g00605 [Babesia microti strain RI]|uniref:Uncharacterized protein n=1 Tax=Babesia microti (strain RI) TaxID=1133968 RepID=I7J5X1_BABMR|nr:hypothetical protein BMR1_02g00605 [Babesia microti strain RI]CCF73287.1 hypothetical protein BMR1_02g00605 [Babesia microti strain RI]|eukprot:XP_012647896.1 hypothetical protein BMR1_02g00605 [Babesia microti strain RI]
MSGVSDDDLFDSVANYLLVTNDGLHSKCRAGVLSRTTWYPGFTRKLGSKGRYELLKLIRNKCNNSEECKFIFRNHDPPISAGKLSFYRVEFLWKIAYMIGVFDEALQMYNKNIKKSIQHKRLDALVNRPACSIKDLEMQLKNSHRIISNVIPGRISKFEFEIIDQLNRFYNIIKMKLSLDAITDSDRGSWHSLLYSLNKIQIPNLCNITSLSSRASSGRPGCSKEYNKALLPP